MPPSVPPSAAVPDAAKAAVDAALIAVIAAAPVPPTPADRDGDGIPDSEDQCPEAAEDRDGFQDGDGCPDPDNDGDGVADAEDKCPNEPGASNRHGCPRPGLRGSQFGAFTSRVQFMFRRARYRTADVPVLHAAAATMKANPQIDRFAVEGHASREGSVDQMNVLSRQRAQIVAEKLISLGVTRTRLIVRGLGDRRPTCREATAQCARTNRRVDLSVEPVQP